MSALAISMCAWVAEGAAQAYNVTGRWWGPYDWDGTANDDCETATHLMAMRGQGDTTVVLHLNGSKLNSQCASSSPRVMLIPPGASAPSWDSLGQAHCPPPINEPNLFCCGHAALPDGRTLFVGGTSVGTNGHKGVQLFDPKLYSVESVTVDGMLFRHGWAVVDTMRRERWYPVATPLPDGRVMVSSGLRHYEAMSFGGMTSSTVAVDRRPDVLASTKHAAWTRYGSIGDTRYRTPPSERQDHTMVYSDAPRMHDNDGGGVVVVYGGRDPSGGILNECWIGWRVGFDAGETWSWIQPSSSAWPSGFAGRYEHSAVAVPGGVSNSTDVYVFGGLKGSGSSTATDELWRIRFRVVGGGDAGNDEVTVTQVTHSGGPSARYGHTAVLDEYTSGTTTNRRMLVFGGRDATGALTDDAVHSLDLSTLTWSVVTAASSGSPRARYRHSAVMDVPAAYLPTAKPRRMVVFGGEGASGLSGDTHVLRRCNDASSCLASYTWESSGSQSNAPSARYMHSAVMDEEWNRMLVFGGDSTGSNGLSRTMYSLPLEHATTSPYNTTLTWSAMPVDSTTTDIEPRARHASIWNNRYVVEKFAEVYDPTQPAGSRWSEMPNAPIYDQLTYPFYFVLPSGNVFYAGRSTRTPYSNGSSQNIAGTRILDRSGSSTPSSWSWGSTRWGSFTGGNSAVMFEPGKIMKFGQPASNPTQGHATAARIEFNDDDQPAVEAGWESESVASIEAFRPQPRVEANMTILPDGTVLISGGRDKHEDDGNAFKRPQLWDPASSAWSDRAVLDPDPTTRGYHSTAIVTPDARLISAGGSRLNNPTEAKGLDVLSRFTVFDPPYLYAGATTLATRPAVASSGLPSIVEPGQRFTVCSSDAASITRVALLKPGSTTHAFNMDQRYVPLEFTAVAGANPRLQVTAPASVNIAPPGDYLLFLTTSSGTPSVGRWMRIETTGGYDLCDTFAPATETQLAACHDYNTGILTMSWVSRPEDAGVTGSGPGTEFALRYSTSPIATGSDWDEAANVELGFTPGPEGTPHSKQMTLPEGTYYFRLRTMDDNGNWSAMSNQRFVEVPHDPPTECFEGGGGGGGGGGFQAGRADDRLAMIPGSGSTMLPNANSLFPAPLRGEATTDLMRLGFDPAVGDGPARVSIVSTPAHSMYLDRVGLMAVDHAVEREAFVSAGSVVTGKSKHVLSMLAANGDTIDHQSTFALVTGEAVTVDLSGSSTLLLGASRDPAYQGGQRSGLLIQTPDGDGWRTLTRHVPRRVAEPVAIPIGNSHVRIVALEDVAIDRVAALENVEPAVIRSALLSSATGPDDEDATGSVGDADTLKIRLSGGASLGSSFTPPSTTPGALRTWFLSASASFGSSGTTSANGRERAPAPEIKVAAYKLYQNHPNPFSHSTTIRFDLARGEAVHLEIYDPSGRRVRTLADGWRPAGSHEVGWNQRDSRGEYVRPGIYLYRLRTSDARLFERKLVVLP